MMLFGWRNVACCAALLAATASLAEENDAAREIAQAAPANDIYVASVERGATGPHFGKPRNVTHRPGYDNQPSFLSDGKRFYYTVIGEDGQADIWLYDLEKGEARQVTKTPESEYSPTEPADGDGISTVRVEKDGAQRLWRYSADGAPVKVLIPDEKAVGYHAWIDESTVALFIVGEPSLLKVADLRSGRLREMGQNIGRSLQRVPMRPGVSYMQPNDDGSQWIKILQWPAGLTRILTQPVEGSEDFLLGGDGELYMAGGKSIYIWERQPGKWRVIADFSAELPGPITRLAMNPRADTIAFVVAEAQ